MRAKARSRRAAANARRDLAVGARHIRRFRRAFVAEGRKVLQRTTEGLDPLEAVDAGSWLGPVAALWVDSIRTVWDETLNQIASDLEPKAADLPEQKADQVETVRQLILRLTGDARTSNAVVNLVRGRAELIADQSRRGIRRVLTLAQESGVTQQSALRRLFKEWEGSRSQRTALQEALTSTASVQHQAASHAAAESGLLVEHVWGTVGDDRVRRTHSLANGQRQPVGSPFIVGGAYLQHPRDPAGPAGEVINCRCSETYRRKHKPRRRRRR